MYSTFVISTEGNKKGRFPNLSENNPVALVIRKRNLKRGRGFTKFKLLSLNPRFDQVCAYDMQGYCYIIDFNDNTYWCLKNEENVSVIEFQCHNKICFGYFNGFIRIFDLVSGKLCGTFNGHVKSVKNISFNQSGDQCISISNDNGFIWNPFTFKKIFSIEPLDCSVIQESKFIPWCYKFVVHTNDHLSVWDSRKGHLMKTFHALDVLGSCISGFAFKKNGSAMIAYGDYNKLLYFDTSSWLLERIFLLPINYTKLKFIEFISPPSDVGESSMVAFLTYHHNIVIYDLIRSTILTIGPIDNDYCANLGINISGKYFYCLTGKGTIHIFHNELWNDEVMTRQDILEEPGHKVHNFYSKQLKVAKNNIRNIISSYGQFPSDLRPFLWRIILSLPMNVAAHRNLCRREFHSAFMNVLKYSFLPIDLRFPVLRLVSNLAHWCPMFQHINSLPLMVLRFVKLFKFSPMMAFEIVATIFVNYCQKWFSEFPLIPQDITKYIEYAIESFNLDLWNHFNRLGIKIATYIWLVMETLFAEVLVENDWLILWDNVLTNKTDFLTLAVAAFFIVNKNQFLSCNSKEEFEFCFYNPVSTNTNIRNLVKITQEMTRSLKLKSNLHDFAPLVRGDTYQLLTDSMELNKVLTLETISNSESALVIRKVMERDDASLRTTKFNTCF